MMWASVLLVHSFGEDQSLPSTPSGTNGWGPDQIPLFFSRRPDLKSIEALSFRFFGERSQIGIIEWRLQTACDVLHKLVENPPVWRACIRLVRSGSWPWFWICIEDNDGTFSSW